MRDGEKHPHSLNTLLVSAVRPSLTSPPYTHTPLGEEQLEHDGVPLLAEAEGGRLRALQPGRKKGW